jgi:hypothetical protein
LITQSANRVTCSLRKTNSRRPSGDQSTPGRSWCHLPAAAPAV